jgi:hypothetical protein
MSFFFPDVFFAAFGPVQKKGIARLEECIHQGGCYCVVWPRGCGKSSVGKCAVIYSTLTGARSFVLAIGASNDLALDYMGFIQANLAGNQLLEEHYPECVGFFKAIDYKAIKARGQLTKDLEGNLVASGIQWRPRSVAYPTILDQDGKPYPFSGAIIETRGITATLKGMSRATPGGKIIRPDFVIADDIQDPETAMSDTLCDKMERTVIGDILPMAGPQTQIACYMPATIMRKGDVSSRFVDRKRHPEFQGELHPLVISWPKAHETLWMEYKRIRLEADDDKSGRKAAHKFYLENRKEMDEGGETSWPGRIRKGKKPTDPHESSAIETAENLLIEWGDRFWAECQGEPMDGYTSQYTLTPEHIASHVLDIPRLHLPDKSTVFTGYIDINQHNGGLHCCLGAFDQVMTAHVPDYFTYPGRDLWPENASEQVIVQAIFAGCKAVCDRIHATTYLKAGKPAQPSLVLIDASFKPDPIHRFAAWANTSRVYAFKVIPSIGRNSSKYYFRRDQLIGGPLEGAHIQRAANDPSKVYAMHNACYWRETGQRAWLPEAGAAGGATLYKSDNPKAHIVFANEASFEVLANKYQTEQGWRWEWGKRGFGGHWDYGDAYIGCWVGAALSGLSASGERVPLPQKRKSRVSVTWAKV